MAEDYRAVAEQRQRPDVNAILQAEGIDPPSTYADRPVSRQNIQLAILDSALADLRGPALLAALGIVCATVGSGLSLWMA